VEWSRKMTTTAVEALLVSGWPLEMFAEDARAAWESKIGGRWPRPMSSIEVIGQADVSVRV